MVPLPGRIQAGRPVRRDSAQMNAPTMESPIRSGPNPSRPTPCINLKPPIRTATKEFKAVVNIGEHLYGPDMLFIRCIGKNPNCLIGLRYLGNGIADLFSGQGRRENAAHFILLKRGEPGERHDGVSA